MLSTRHRWRMSCPNCVSAMQRRLFTSARASNTNPFLEPPRPPVLWSPQLSAQAAGRHFRESFDDLPLFLGLGDFKINRVEHCPLVG
eukprot:33299-Heterocapsa_arctica.AAC.1